MNIPFLKILKREEKSLFESKTAGWDTQSSQRGECPGEGTFGAYMFFYIKNYKSSWQKTS